MTKLRKHWSPFWLHVYLHPVNYALTTLFGALGLSFLAPLWHDPPWVGRACIAVEALYFLVWLGLQIAAYRTCTGHRLDRSQTHDRNDIWKDGWPW